MNKEESKKVFSQYPTNQMVEMETPNAGRLEEKQENKKSFTDWKSTYMGVGI